MGSMHWLDGFLGWENRFYSIGVFWVFVLGLLLLVWLIGYINDRYYLPVLFHTPVNHTSQSYQQQPLSLSFNSNNICQSYHSTTTCHRFPTLPFYYYCNPNLLTLVYYSVSHNWVAGNYFILLFYLSSRFIFTCGIS